MTQLLKRSPSFSLLTSLTLSFSMMLPATISLAASSALAADGPELTDSEIDALWSNVDGKKRKWVSSNPWHYWAWSKMHAPQVIDSQLLEQQGWVMADPHHRNVFDFHHDKQAELAIADIDDSGFGPFVLDIARFIVYTRAAKIDVEISEILQSYFGGLNGESVKADLVEKSLKVSYEEIYRKHLKHLQKHFLPSGKLDYKEKDLADIDDIGTAKHIKKEYAEVKLIMENFLQEKFPKYQILAKAHTVNDNGSSNGMDRYWFYVGPKGKPAEWLFEMKKINNPAIAYYQTQADTDARVAHVLNYYAPQEIQELFQIVKLAGDGKNEDRYFWLRPRHFQDLDIDLENSEDKRLFKELTHYIANWMGKAQAKQLESPKYMNLLTSKNARFNDRTPHQQIEHFVKTYEDEMKRLQTAAQSQK